MQNSKLQQKIKNYKIVLILIGFVLVLGFIANLFLVGRIMLKGNSYDDSPILNSPVLVKPASAQEIYSLFICPCCGKTIDQGCCGMAEERKAYVDGLVEGKLSHDEIVSAYVKKYGLESFKDKDKQKEFREKLVAEAPADRPIISLSPESYDLGDVSQKQKVVTTTFELKNEGESGLIIDRLETSCGCTSASIVYQGEEGPKFNMPGHGINEKIKNWQVVIPSGEQAELKVYYDTDVHPDFRGSAIRSISVFSNDPVDFEKKVQIELNQVD